MQWEGVNTLIFYFFRSPLSPSPTLHFFFSPKQLHWRKIKTFQSAFMFSSLWGVFTSYLFRLFSGAPVAVKLARLPRYFQGLSWRDRTLQRRGISQMLCVFSPALDHRIVDGLYQTTHIISFRACFIFCGLFTVFLIAIYSYNMHSFGRNPCTFSQNQWDTLVKLRWMCYIHN